MDKDGQKKFTSEELKNLDGSNGQPLYIVFKGKVYNLTTSKLWPQGKHMGIHTRNEDLTSAIKGAPHGEDNIYRFPMVGEYETVAEQVPLPQSQQREVVTPQAEPSPSVESTLMQRRTFLKLVAAAGGAITIGAVLSTLKAGTFVPPATTTAAWPIVTVTNISKLTNLTPVVFYYPLTNTPNYLVKLGVAATGGIGPNKDIVAFSAICQHLGCEYDFVAPGGSPPCNAAYKATIPMGYCCCHGSQYNLVEGAKVIGGPAPRPVPMVQLQFDSSNGDISAIGMQPPTIYGHGPPGTTDLQLVMQYDLQGGDLVTQATVLG